MTYGTEPSARRQNLASSLVLTSCIVVGLVLRFWRLGDWNFQATEIFTLRDSLSPKLTNPRPLGYLLNYYLVRPFRPLDEFGLRLLPALFGVAAIPVFYFVARRLVGTRAALFGAFFLALSPLLILYSQLARYWSLVFLLCTVYPYALYLGLRDRSPRAIVLGVVTGLLAALAHPVSVLLVGGLVLWILITYLRPDYMAELWRRKGVRWGALSGLVAAAAIVLRFIPVLRGWVSEHDKNPGSGQFLLPPPPPPGLKQLVDLSAFAESLTLPLILLAGLGVYALWQRRDRTLANLLLCLAGVPIAFVTLISLRTPVSTYYLLPTVPVFFIGLGVFFDRLSDADRNWSPSWLLPATLAAMVFGAGAPTLISDMRDGRRYDFRGVAQWLKPHLAPGDVVISDQHMVLGHYLPEAQVQRLRQDTIPLSQSVGALRQSGRGQALWIVAPAASHAFRTNLRPGGLLSWIYDNCQIRYTRGVGRVDFRQQYLQIYRCSAAAQAGLGRSDGGATPPEPGPANPSPSTDRAERGTRPLRASTSS